MGWTSKPRKTKEKNKRTYKPLTPTAAGDKPLTPTPPLINPPLLGSIKPSAPSSTGLSEAPGSTVPPAPGAFLGMLTRAPDWGGATIPEGNPSLRQPLGIQTLHPDVHGALWGSGLRSPSGSGGPSGHAHPGYRPGGQRSPKGEPQKDRASPVFFGFPDRKNGLARGRWKNNDFSASQ